MFSVARLMRWPRLTSPRRFPARRPFHSIHSKESSRLGCAVYYDGPFKNRVVHVAGHNRSGDATVAPPSSTDSFEHDLKSLVFSSRTEGLNAVWLVLDYSQAHLCSAAFAHGFGFHSVKSSETLLLCQWLAPEVENRVPPAPSTQIGVGGFCMNARNELLLVKERSMTSVDRLKMPGGLVDPGESILKAAEREVLEETGVRARAVSVLTFWQRSLDGSKSGLPASPKSDIYAVCRLGVESSQDERIQFCEYEIKEARWVGLDEYMSLSESQQHPMLLNVLVNNFGFDLSSAQGRSRLARAARGTEPVVPLAELGLDHLQVSAKSDPFPTFVMKRNNNTLL